MAVAFSKRPGLGRRKESVQFICDLLQSIFRRDQIRRLIPLYKANRRSLRVAAFAVNAIRAR
jgi:hypothetical protein